MLQVFSNREINSSTREDVYQGIITTMVNLSLLDYYPKTNEYVGTGFYDIVLLPKDKDNYAYIVELKRTSEYNKLDQKLKEGMKQIDEKNYLKKIENFKKKIKMVIAFCGKEVRIEHEIVK